MTLAVMKMSDQRRKAEYFRALHVPGTPLVLFNIWDAGSAKAVAASGAKAIATSSWSVAHANGFSDGEQISLTLAIENLRDAAATIIADKIDLIDVQGIEKFLKHPGVGRDGNVLAGRDFGVAMRKKVHGYAAPEVG